LEEYKHVTPCLALILDILDKLFSFDDLYEPENEQILRDILYKITTKRPTSSAPQLLDLIPDAFQFFYDASSVLSKDMKLAVAVFNVMKGLLRKKDAHPHLCTKLSQLAGTFLKTEWSKEQHFKVRTVTKCEPHFHSRNLSVNC
jgi:hypothetical protein